MSEVGAVQMPVYNRSDPALWFIMCESTFKLAVPKPITESVTKFSYVVFHLPPEVASLVRDILMDPDATDPYTHLKTELINRSGESSQQEIRQLLSGEELGTRKLSELLRNMKRRAETLKIPETFMLELFLQRLPTSVQTILAAVTDLTLDKAAAISDRILEVTPVPMEIHATSRRLFIRDRISNISFLVDTGSDVSLIPANTYQKRNSSQQTLFAANSSTINVYGQKTLSLNFNSRRDFLWTFLIADVSIPILGADFLHYFELVPDLRNKCLRDTKTKLQSVGHLKYADLHSVQISISEDTIYHKLLKEFPSITKTSLGTFSLPDARFTHIHIDIVGPLPPSEGQIYLLTIIDRFSRWPEEIPIPDMRAKTICRAIFDTWISRFGCPSVVTSDQGSQLRSSMFVEFTRMLGTQKIKTTPYHPISNGTVERFHRHLKSAIKAHENEKWSELIPIILLGIRTAVKEDLQSSCSELVYGTTLRLPCDMIDVSDIPPCDIEFITDLRDNGIKST
ncbi:Gag-Pol polyprotein [Araneus ventricosus]|uniref:Gag-Pol polyprotein n=1 Tax=Araneus ventricosus TaxID=182803 RepID=A0A4Y2KHI6_ARAVE|nr:Gag-Pol polyprotein [Araneus ventricosus]